MNPSGGYDFEAVGDMGIDFECPICLLLLREAAELPCLHVFCKLCLENWQVSPMERNTELLCPSCKNVYQRDQVNGNKYLDKLIKTSFQVKCKESKFGCEWKGSILDYANHENKCSCKSINCDLVGCEERMLRIDQQKHQSKCLYRLVQCQHCKLEIQLINIQTHHECCTGYIVHCPNERCCVAIPRKQIADHTQNECPYQVVDCKYVSVGCSYKFQRRRTNEHENNTLAEHMNLLLNRVQLTSMKLCTVEEKLQITEEKLQKTEERLQITEEKFLKTEETLTATNENLEKTNAILNDTKDELETPKADSNKANDKILQLNKSIENLKHHKLELDKTCFQLTRFAVCMKYQKNISTASIVESLKSLHDGNAKRVVLTSEKVLEFDEKHRKIIHSPDNLPVLYKTLEDTLNDINKLLELSNMYPYRFKQVMDVLETNKLYRTSDKEVFVKVDVTNHLHWDLRAFFDPEYKAKYKKHPKTLFFSKEFVLFDCNPNLNLYLYLDKWHTSNTSSFIMSPMEKSISNITHMSQSSIGLRLNNMVLISSIKISRAR